MLDLRRHSEGSETCEAYLRLENCLLLHCVSANKGESQSHLCTERTAWCQTAYTGE